MRTLLQLPSQVSTHHDLEVLRGVHPRSGDHLQVWEDYSLGSSAFIS
jgi:hypothetical protein